MKLQNSASILNISDVSVRHKSGRARSWVTLKAFRRRSASAANLETLTNPNEQVCVKKFVAYIRVMNCPMLFELLALLPLSHSASLSKDVSEHLQEVFVSQGQGRVTIAMSALSIDDIKDILLPS